VDYVSANRQGASEVGRRRRSTTPNGRGKARQTAEAAAARSQHKVGQVPAYLVARRERWKREAEEEKAARPDPDCPAGHAPLSNIDRLASLETARARRETLLREANFIPVSSDTLRVRRRRREIEEELTKVEEDIRKYQRPKVYVKIAS